MLKGIIKSNMVCQDILPGLTSCSPLTPNLMKLNEPYLTWMRMEQNQLKISITLSITLLQKTFFFPFYKKEEKKQLLKMNNTNIFALLLMFT